MNIIKQYNKIGKKYVAGQKKFFAAKDDVSAKFIFKNMPNIKGKTILDFGCGHGKMIEKLEKMEARKVVGIDVSKVMIEEARAYLGKKSDLYVEDIQKTNFPSGYFDIVIGRFTLHYLDSFEKAYSEIARILKKNGVLIFVVDHPLRDFYLKKTKAYWKKEMIKIGLYEKSIVINFPSHTLGDYFSKSFLNKFILEDFKEGVTTEAQTAKELPDYMAVKAVKK